MVFIIQKMKTMTQEENKKWIGYTFSFDEGDERRPSHPFHENPLHPPMMVNTHCEEKGETYNLTLNYVDDNVIFEAVKDIVGGDKFVVDYGRDYNKELYEERQEQKRIRQQSISARRNLNHNFKCQHCGYTCHNKFRIRHFNECSLRSTSKEAQEN